MRIAGRRLSLQALFAGIIVAFAVACGGGGSGGNGASGTAPAVTDSLLATGQGGDLQLIQLPGVRQSTLIHLQGATVLDPSASADGKKIAFVRSPDFAVGQTDFGTDIYMANRDGSAPTALVKHSAPSELLRWPVFLADGSGLIFQVQGTSVGGIPTSRLDSVNLATGERGHLIDNGMTPGFSRDGQTLAFVTLDLTVGRQQIWIANRAAQLAKAVVTSSNDLGAFGTLAVSPDGSQVAFGAATLKTGAAVKPRSLPVAQKGPAEKPDPTRILTDGLPEDIWVVNRDGSGLHRVLALGEDQPSLAWSSDGKSLYSMGGTGLWQINAASGDKKRLGDGVVHGEIFLLATVSP